jgi:hypothetical protein
MSERATGDQDPRAVSEIPDETLAAHLDRRARRPAPRALTASIMARVAEATPERRWRLTVAAWRPRFIGATSALALVLVAGLLVISALPAPVGTERGSPPPSPAGPPPSGPIWDPTVRALTPPELLRIMATDPPVGTTLIVDDQIVSGALVSCAVGPNSCATGRLVNAGTLVAAPPGGHMPFDAGPTISGPLAFEVGLGSVLVFLGGVVSNGTRLEFTATDLARRSAMGGLFVIPAWIHRGPVVACPSVVAPHAPLPTSEVGLPAPEIQPCSGVVYLTDADPGPAPYRIPDADPDAFPVQQDAYQRFAPDPRDDGSASGGVFLVRDWAGYGEILARLEPVPIPPVDTGQATARPPTSTTWDPTVRPLTPSESARIVAAHPPFGTILIVDDEITEGVFDCATPGACPDGLLSTGTAVYAPVYAPPGGHLPRTVTGKIPGPVALRIGDGGHLEFLGTVAGDGQQIDFTTVDVATGERDRLYIVPSWLWREAPLPCPTSGRTPPPSPISELGLPAPHTDICGGANYLSDDAPNLPLSGTPVDGLLVQNQAYREFAPNPDDAGAPREGVYLVRGWGRVGEVVARFEPIAIPAPAPAPTDAPSAPAIVAPTTPTAGRVMTADEFVGRVLDGTLASGSIVVADIPASAVSVLSPTGAGTGEVTGQSRWSIHAGGGLVRVDGIAQDGIAGRQAFLVEPSRAVLTLGGVTVDDIGSLGLLMAHGWLRNGPPLPCPAPAHPIATGIGGEPLAWSQCPGTWILPTAADPWPGPGDYAKVGDGSMPAGTLHVQDNALGTYVEASEGVWLVRRVFSNACPPWAYCPLTPADRPGPGVSWYELVGPVAAPPLDAVEQRPPPTAAP